MLAWTWHVCTPLLTNESFALVIVYVAANPVPVRGYVMILVVDTHPSPHK